MLRKSQIERTRRRVAKKCVDEHETEKKNKSLHTGQPVTAGVVECKCIALHSTLFLQRWSCVLPFLFHSPSLTEKRESHSICIILCSCGQWLLNSVGLFLILLLHTPSPSFAFRSPIGAQLAVHAIYCQLCLFTLSSLIVSLLLYSNCPAPAAARVGCAVHCLAL